MINIIFRKFKDQRKSIIYYFAGLFAYVWLMVGMFPSMKKFDMVSLYDQFPKEFLKFFGGEDMQSLGTIEGFLSIEFLSLFFILIISFYVASSAGSSIAGAIEKKTMDFQLSQPIGRTKLILSESIVTLANTFLLVLLTVLSIYLLCQAYNIDINTKGLIAFAAIATIFLWSIYGIAIFISSILKNKITVTASTVAIVMAFYILTAMTNIIDKLKNFDKFSLFYTYNPQKLLQSGEINIHHLEALFSIFIIGLILSLSIFQKKDI